MLEVKNLSKIFDGEAVLHDLSFTLPSRHMLSVLGRSGSGKTTLLKIIAGLDQPGKGEILLDGVVINKVPPHRRGIVYIYQEALLFPHLNAFDNIAFGLRLKREEESLVKERTDRLVERLELSGQEHKMPHQLSGGQRQRVAFGRALIINPKLLLLDEPFGALDAETRERMQELLQEIMTEFGMTGIFVTHDLKEALLMGDGIATMVKGRLRRYPDKGAFIEDVETGVQREMTFWQEIGERKSRPGHE